MYNSLEETIPAIRYVPTPILLLRQAWYSRCEGCKEKRKKDRTQRLQALYAYQGFNRTNKRSVYWLLRLYPAATCLCCSFSWATALFARFPSGQHAPHCAIHVLSWFRKLHIRGYQQLQGAVTGVCTRCPHQLTDADSWFFLLLLRSEKKISCFNLSWKEQMRLLTCLVFALLFARRVVLWRRWRCRMMAFSHEERMIAVSR